jgi:GNAT superfamily N-acetyltransferase
VSRNLRAFEDKGWLRRKRSAGDARQSVLSLTAAGRRAFAPLEQTSHDQVAKLLAPLAQNDAAAVVTGMQTIERVLGGASPQPSTVTLRTHRPGDIGWIVQRHGELYAQELGWDETFEALVADIAARFIRRFDARWERCWIAERDGTRIGSVMVVRRSATVAQLRLLLLEPSTRGLGLGKQLVDECIRFARECGYRRMMLWTNGGLDTARAVYESRGFRLTGEERHHSFGHDLVGQTFELKL